MPSDEETRAAGYRDQLVARDHALRARARALHGSRQARDQALANWQPIRDAIADAQARTPVIDPLDLNRHKWLTHP